jgi:hypothetical protein
MAKKKKKLKEHSGNNLHIEFPRWTSGNSYITTSIILRPITPISIYGDNTAFDGKANMAMKL